MTEDLLHFLRENKKKPDEDKLTILIRLTEKMMAMVFAVQSQNRRLEDRIRALEYKNQPAPTYMKEVSTVPPPPPPPSTYPSRPLGNQRVRNEIMEELKDLFKRREEVIKINGKR